MPIGCTSIISYFRIKKSLKLLKLKTFDFVTKPDSRQQHRDPHSCGGFPTFAFGSRWNAVQMDPIRANLIIPLTFKRVSDDCIKEI